MIIPVIIPVRRPDDSGRAQRETIRAHARRALLASGALGHLPTDVAAVMVIAKATEIPDDVLRNPAFLRRMRIEGDGFVQAVIDGPRPAPPEPDDDEGE